MYDYTIKSELENGQVKTISYQKMLLMVDMQNEIMHGAKLSEGGLPQVISFISLITKAKQSLQYNNNQRKGQ
jgi:hypothetical protein